MHESVIQWPLGLDDKDLVGAGNTAIVARLDRGYFPGSLWIVILDEKPNLTPHAVRHNPLHSLIRYLGEDQSYDSASGS